MKKNEKKKRKGTEAPEEKIEKFICVKVANGSRSGSNKASKMAMVCLRFVFIV